MSQLITKPRAAGLLLSFLSASAVLTYGNSTALFSADEEFRSASYLQQVASDFAEVLIPTSRAAEKAAGEQSTKWTCPMHPHYIATDFGQCPICGMDLVEMNVEGPDVATSASEARTAVTVRPEFMQSMGIRLAEVEESRFGRHVRSFGIVQENERLQQEITARVEGWVEELKVRAVGDEVQPGTPLFKLYSPQLIVSQNDYLISNQSKSLKAQARAHLSALGVQPRTITELEKSKQPLHRVPFYADSGGTISELYLREGSYVKRGMLLARIQDYSSVWLMVSVQEKDLSAINSKTSALVTFPSLSGTELRARVDYIYPTVDPKTRTGRVRLVLDNPNGQIRPGSYADVVFEVASEHRLAIPTESVLRNGEGSHVVVSLGGGRFEPRSIRTGQSSGRWTEVVKGLTAGDTVVTSGQFLLDSESALRESFRKLQQLQLPLDLLELTTTELAMLDHMIDAAIYVHEALIDGYDLEPKFLEPAIAIREQLWSRYQHTQLAFVMDDAKEAIELAQKAQTESEIQRALSQLVEALRPWVQKGNPAHYSALGVSVYLDKGSERAWLQTGDQVLNPYGRGAAEKIELRKPNSAADPSDDDPKVAGK